MFLLGCHPGRPFSHSGLDPQSFLICFVVMLSGVEARLSPFDFAQANSLQHITVYLITIFPYLTCANRHHTNVYSCFPILLYASIKKAYHFAIEAYASVNLLIASTVLLIAFITLLYHIFILFAAFLIKTYVSVIKSTASSHIFVKRINNGIKGLNELPESIDSYLKSFLLSRRGLYSMLHVNKSSETLAG